MLNGRNQCKTTSQEVIDPWVDIHTNLQRTQLSQHRFQCLTSPELRNDFPVGSLPVRAQIQTPSPEVPHILLASGLSASSLRSIPVDHLSHLPLLHMSLCYREMDQVLIARLNQQVASAQVSLQRALTNLQQAHQVNHELTNQLHQAQNLTSLN